MLVDDELAGLTVFLSASIPDPDRWEGQFHPLEITDAVVAAARAVLSSRGRLVTAAHPTIAPLLLYVAGEFPMMNRQPPPILVYQSRLFEDMLPRETYDLVDRGLGEMRWTDRVPGDDPHPTKWNESLALMRHEMLAETEPIAAVFIGGMEGITEEYELFRELRPGRPMYPIAAPGGETRAVLRDGGAALDVSTLSGVIYPSLFRAVVRDIGRRARDQGQEKQEDTEQDRGRARPNGSS
jgi:hypothetical protein